MNAPWGSILTVRARPEHASGPTVPTFEMRNSASVYVNPGPRITGLEGSTSMRIESPWDDPYDPVPAEAAAAVLPP